MMLSPSLLGETLKRTWRRDRRKRNVVPPVNSSLLRIEPLEERLTPTVHPLDYSGVLPFTIIPEQSALTFGFSVLGVSATEQFPGSMTTRLAGDLTATFGGGVVSIETTNVDLEEKPQSALPLNAPADLSQRNNLGIFVFYTAIRDAVVGFTLTSAMNAIDPPEGLEAGFESISTFEFVQGVQYSAAVPDFWGLGLVQINLSELGLIEDDDPGEARVRNEDGVFILTLPFALSTSVDVDGIVVTASVSGQIVAVSDPIDVPEETLQATLETSAVNYVPVSSATIRFSDAILSTEALDSANYTLLDLGPNQVLGGGDDQAVPFTLSYDDEEFTVTLHFAAQSFGTFRITAASGAEGIRTADGRILDGDGDGLIGDDFIATFTVDAVGPSIENVAVLGHSAIAVEFSSNVGMDGDAAADAGNYALFGRVQGTGEYVDLSAAIAGVDYAAAGATATVRLGVLSAEAASVAYSEFELRLGDAVRDALGRPLEGDASPIVPLLSFLAGAVFDDADVDGVQAPAGEVGFANVVVYLDADDDGRRGFGEVYARTDATGRYTFWGLPAGEHRVRIERPAFLLYSTPALGVGVVNLPGPGAPFGVDFGLYEPPSIDLHPNSYVGGATFRLVSDLSPITIHYSFDFTSGDQFESQEQYEGSATARFSGETGWIFADFQFGYVELFGLFLDLVEGSAPALPGSTPADLAVEVPQLTTFLAARDLQFLFNIVGLMTPSPFGGFESTLASVSALGLMDGLLNVGSGAFGDGDLDLQGVVFSNTSPGGPPDASIRTFGESFLLTLPIDLVFSELFENPFFTATVTLTGQITAVSDPIVAPSPTVALQTPPVSYDPVSSVTLVFSEPILADAAQDLANYSIVDLGPDGSPGGGDDQNVPFFLFYDDLQNAATLFFAERTQGTFQVSVRSGPFGIRTPDGRALDGDADGFGGDDFIAMFTVDAVGPSIVGVDVVDERAIVVQFDASQGLNAAAGVLANYRLFGRDADTGDFLDISFLMQSASFQPGAQTARIELGAVPAAAAGTDFTEFELRVGDAVADLLGRPIHGDSNVAVGLYPAIAGTVFNDVDRNGSQGGAGETGLANVVVFLDLDGDLQRGGDDPWTTTNGDGRYTFYGLPAGQYAVRIEPPSGRIYTTPSSVAVDASSGATLASAHFGLATPAAGDPAPIDYVGTLPFTIDPDLSSMTFSVTISIGGVHTTASPQFAGSETTSLLGQIYATFDAGRIQIDGLDLDLEEQPGATRPFLLPADLSLVLGAAESPLGRAIYFAIRDLRTSFSLTAEMQAVDGDPLAATFDSIAVMKAVGGILDTEVEEFASGWARVAGTVFADWASSVQLVGAVQSEDGRFVLTLPYSLELHLLTIEADPLFAAFLPLATFRAAGAIVARSAPVNFEAPNPIAVVDSPTFLTTPTSSLKIRFSEPVLASEALDPANYTLLYLGADGAPGGGDDQATPLSVAYDPDAREATLQFATLPNGRHQLTVRSGANGIRTADGRQLDGDADGVGGDALVQILEAAASPPTIASVAFVDNTAILVQFSSTAEMDAATVENLSNYFAAAIDANNNVVDASVSMKSVSFDPTTQTARIELGAASQETAQTFFPRVELRASVRITDNEGRPLAGGYSLSPTALDPYPAVAGGVFYDGDGDGQPDDPDNPVGIPNIRVYLDANDNQQWDEGEPFMFTDANGFVTFYALAPGTHRVRIEAPAGQIVTTPPGGIRVVATSPNIYGFTAIFGLTDAAGDEVRWTGLGDGVSWHDRDNWDVRIPTAIDHVTIGAAAGPLVRVDGPAVVVASLASGAALDVRASMLVAGNLFAGADVDLLGALNVGGVAAVGGSLRILPNGAFNAGSLAVLGDLENDGYLQVALAVDVGGSYSQTGALAVNPAISNQVSVQGPAALGGELWIFAPGGFTASPGDSFTVIAAASATGGFTSVIGGVLNSGLRLAAVVDAASVRLVVVRIPGITDVYVPEDAADSLLDLDAAFQLENVVGYEVLQNTRPDLATPYVEGSLLRLSYAPNAFGATSITVRATTSEGIQSDATYNVVVAAVNDPPTVAAPIDDLAGPADPAQPIVVPLAPVFFDVEDSPSDLRYEVVAVADQTLFRSATIAPGSTDLVLVPAQDAFGQAIVTVRATDRDGAFVETSFVVVIGSPGAPDALEPNNALAQASNLGPLAPGAVVVREANIHSPVDVDVYRFSLAGPALVHVDASAHRLGGTLDSALEILDAAGARLFLVDDVVGLDPAKTALLSAGTYFIRVVGVGGTTGGYRLNVRVSQPAPRVLRMTPSTTLAAAPSAIDLYLDDFAVNKLDPATVVPSAFRLLRVSAAGGPVVDVSGRISGVSYDPAANRIRVALSGALADGAYRLVALDSLATPDGRLLDGDVDGLPGGSFVGEFAVDTTPAQGAFAAQAIAGGSAAGLVYRFGGVVQDAFPGRAGEVVQVQIDVDGDGFDDGSAWVVLGAGPTEYSVVSTTPIPGGVGIRTVRARFVDARGNVSPPLSTTIDANTPAVADVRIEEDRVVVVFSVGGLQGADDPNNYGVTGRSIDAVSYDAATRTATVRLAGGPVEDGAYTVTIFSGPTGVRVGGVFLDGDGDLAPGGNAVRTLVVDTVPPVATDVALASGTSNVLGQPVTSETFPTISLVVSDVFPSTATGAITIQLDVDGDGFDDGEIVVVLSADMLDDDGRVAVQIAPTVPLPEGTFEVLVNVLDANGNSAGVQSLTIAVDRTGPAVVRAEAAASALAQGVGTSVASAAAASLAAAATGEAGAPIGIVYRIEFDEPLDPQAARNLANYRLIGAGGDRNFGNFNETSGDAALRVEFLPESPTKLVVYADVVAAGLEDDLYRLVLSGRGVTDLAGNGLRAGDFSIDFDFSTAAPQIVDARLESAFVGGSPNRVLVQFTDVDLDAASAVNPANYSLIRIADGAAATLTSAAYDRFADRVVLTVGSALPPGQYRLTVRGVRNLTGVALASEFQKTFTVSAANQTLTLNPVVLQGNADSFEARVREALPQMRQSLKDLMRAEFTERLRNEIFVAAALGLDVSARVREIFESERAAEYGFQNFLPPEFILVWGSGVRFLLFGPDDDPASFDGRARIGFGLDGSPIQELSDAVLVGDPFSPDGVSLALVPLDLAVRLIGDEAARVDGKVASPDLLFRIETEAVGSNPLAGLLYFASTDRGSAVGVRELDVPPGEIGRIDLDLSDVLEGFDPNIRLFTGEILAGLIGVLGPLESLQTNLLVIWFDPVDFILTDARSRVSGDAPSQGVNLRSAAGSFYSIASDGLTELLVVPGALADVYDLKLFGLGDRFRGEAVFVKAGGDLASARLQGLLGSLDFVAAQLDFGFRDPIVSPRNDDPGFFDDTTRAVTTTELTTRVLAAVLTNILIGAPLTASEGGPAADGADPEAQNAAELRSRVAGADGDSPVKPDPPDFLEWIAGLLNLDEFPVPPQVMGGVGQALRSVAPTFSAVLSIVEYLRQIAARPAAAPAAGADPADSAASPPAVDWNDERRAAPQSAAVVAGRPGDVDLAFEEFDASDMAFAAAVGGLASMRTGRACRTQRNRAGVSAAASFDRPDCRRRVAGSPID